MEKKLNWDDFIKLGNPNNAPEEPKEVKPSKYDKYSVYAHYEKKGRGGKEVVIIKGIDEKEEELEKIAKKLKSNLGVGGSVNDGEIVISGNKRDKIIEILQEMGFKKIKKVGG